MIRIRECANAADEAFFWQELHAYFERDLFPDAEDEDREYFLGEDYREGAQKMHDRANDRLHYLLFERDGTAIGFVMGAVYDTEDDRCYLMEFCVFPEYRGGGTGRECARLFFDWAYAQGAAYIELNAHTEQRRRFWRSVGFVDNGRDDWGDPLLMLPPKQHVPFAAERLTAYDDWQLCRLVNGMRCEAGGEALSDAERDALATELAAGRQAARVVRRGFRMVGLRLTDSSGALLGEFVEPAFRGQGAEALLRQE